MLAQDHYLCIIIGMFFFPKKCSSKVLWVLLICYLFQNVKGPLKCLEMGYIIQCVDIISTEKKEGRATHISNSSYPFLKIGNSVL